MRDLVFWKMFRINCVIVHVVQKVSVGVVRPIGRPAYTPATWRRLMEKDLDQKAAALSVVE